MATAWIHNRKGRITGEIVRQDETWIWVRLKGDHQLRYGSESNRARIDGDGEILCVRREYMREISERK